MNTLTAEVVDPDTFNRKVLRKNVQPERIIVRTLADHEESLYLIASVKKTCFVCRMAGQAAENVTQGLAQEWQSRKDGKKEGFEWKTVVGGPGWPTLYRYVQQRIPIWNAA